jgi:hypothetical protein
MKNFSLLLFPILLTVGTATAQDQTYRVVFDLTSKDTLVQKALIRWVTEISKSDAGAMLDVVLYGKSLDLITKGKSSFAPQINSLLGNPNVSFKVCAIALKNNQVEKDQLFPGVAIVPDGIREIYHRQQQGWGYIKAGL